MFFRTLILGCLIASTYSALWNVFSMKKCIGGKSLYYYNGYGCNCGLGRDYKLPVDDVDICCVRHKGCYSAAVESGDCKYWFLPYFTNYKWKCTSGNPVCSEEEPTNLKSACAAAICNCDSEFVSCLKENDFSDVKPRCLSTSNSNESKQLSEAK
uniref:PA2c domain-containing protein n=1 Tax=Elaeophora elaphi TaxID=1147741 RepID=A0A0R3RQT3_9BILA